MVGSPSGCLRQDNDVIHYFSLVGKLELSGARGRVSRGRQSGRGKIIGEFSDIESGHEKCNQSF